MAVGGVQASARIWTGDASAVHSDAVSGGAASGTGAVHGRPNDDGAGPADNDAFDSKGSATLHL